MSRGPRPEGASPRDIRLEVLKLVHRHDREPGQIIARADDLVAWIEGRAKPVAPPTEAVE